MKSLFQTLKERAATTPARAQPGEPQHVWTREARQEALNYVYRPAVCCLRECRSPKCFESGTVEHFSPEVPGRRIAERTAPRRFILAFEDDGLRRECSV